MVQRGRYRNWIRQVAYLSLVFYALESPAQLVFSKNARTADLTQSSLLTKSMAHACLGIKEISDSIPCQPAHTHFNRVPGLQLQILISNGYANLEKAQRLIGGDIGESFLTSVFSGNNVLQIEGSGVLDFKSKYINARWLPGSVRMFSAIRNEANPAVEVFAVDEKGFTFQSGFALLENLNVGLQSRVLERKYIRKKFFLVSLGTQEGRDLLKPKSQRIITFEPGISYQIPFLWDLTMSVLVANGGSYSEKFSDLESPVEAQFGVTFSPPIGFGKLEVSGDYKRLNSDDPTDRFFHLGAGFTYGSMLTTAGIDRNGISGGVFYSIEKLHAGITFTSTQIPGASDYSYTQTTYAQLGYTL